MHKGRPADLCSPPIGKLDEVISPGPAEDAVFVLFPVILNSEIKNSPGPEFDGDEEAQVKGFVIIIPIGDPADRERLGDLVGNPLADEVDPVNVFTAPPGEERVVVDIVGQTQAGRRVQGDPEAEIGLPALVGVVRIIDPVADGSHDKKIHPGERFGTQAQEGFRSPEIDAFVPFEARGNVEKDVRLPPPVQPEAEAQLVVGQRPGKIMDPHVIDGRRDRNQEGPFEEETSTRPGRSRN